MADVKVLSSKRRGEEWTELIDALRASGVKVYYDPLESDVSIVLSGKYENPTSVKGKKILAYDSDEWIPFLNPPSGWNAYKRVLTEYYDGFIDLTRMATEDRVKRIKGAIHAANKQRS